MANFLQPPPQLADAWHSDLILRQALHHFLGDDVFGAAETELAAMGRIATSSEILDLAARAELEPPVHVPYGPWGHRRDEIRVSGAYLQLGRIGVEAGVTSLPYEATAYAEKARVVWAGLLAMWGPSSALYSCPVAMTDGAARTLLQFGGDEDVEVAARLTSRDPDFAWSSGQWMTETTGGSDLSRTETVAVRDDAGTWRLSGTKWFTSATTSEMALTLARPQAAGVETGSSALALFRIHRVNSDGTPNHITVRRLKDKLGTRALPTAELELHGAIGYPVGDPLSGGGIKKIATMLNITRIHNSLGAAGNLGRGLAWARAHARVREAGGRALTELPAHRATLADLAVDYAATLMLSLRCSQLLGRVEHGVAHSDDASLLRGLTPIAKLATARWAIAGVTEAMECVGGVGYCEDSTLPALVRNTHVLPIWEGTTNVLALDFLRAARSGALDSLLNDSLELAAAAEGLDALEGPVRAVRTAVASLRAAAEAAALDDASAHAGARSLAMSVARSYACALLCSQAAHFRNDGRPAAIAARWADRGLLSPGPPADTSFVFDDSWHPPERAAIG
jgi:acyl-CoA dehydrogenase